MAEPSQIMFKFPEIAEALVRTQRIHEGHWGLLVKFAVGAANVPGPEGDLVPTAFVPIKEMGLRKFDEPNSLTVDAAKVNPKRQSLPPGTAKAKSAKSKRKKGV